MEWLAGYLQVPVEGVGFQGLFLFKFRMLKGLRVQCSVIHFRQAVKPTSRLMGLSK